MRARLVRRMIHAAGLSRAQLRRQLRQLRRQLSPSEQKKARLALHARLSQHPLFRRARHVALYLPADGEIDPSLLTQAAHRRGKHVYLPVLRAWPHNRMDFQRLGRHEKLVRNRFGIAEPKYCRARQRQPWALDLLLLPLVGFDESGGRLGMGGGFYDRSLAYLGRRKKWRKPTMLGLAHECQKVDRLNLASWDVRLDAIITDGAWYPSR